MPKKITGEKSTAVACRIPRVIAHDIDVLIEKGFYKDRADFLYQATLAYLESEKKRLAGRVVELEIPLPPGKPDASPQRGERRPLR